MAYVELDYSIDQERAICPQGLFFLKYGFFRVLPLLITRGRLLRDATRDEDESYYCSRQKRRCKLHSQSPLSRDRVTSSIKRVTPAPRDAPSALLYRSMPEGAYT